MESPVPLYPTDCPPPYEAVMGQRAASQVSVWVCVYLYLYVHLPMLILLRFDCQGNNV